MQRYLEGCATGNRTGGSYLFRNLRLFRTVDILDKLSRNQVVNLKGCSWSSENKPSKNLDRQMNILDLSMCTRTILNGKTLL